MKFKAGVKCFGVKPETLFIFFAVENAYLSVLNIEPTVTAITDGKHGSDRHGKGYAVDVRTRDDNSDKQWDIEIKQELREAIKLRLTDEFDVVVEDTHIHIEIDRRSGAV
jgi:hypothetical protein